MKLEPPRPAANARRELWKLRGQMVLGTLIGTIGFGLWIATLPRWVQDRSGPFLVICCVVGLWQSLTCRPGKL